MSCLWNIVLQLVVIIVVPSVTTIANIIAIENRLISPLTNNQYWLPQIVGEQKKASSNPYRLLCTIDSYKRMRCVTPFRSHIIFEDSDLKANQFQRRSGFNKKGSQSDHKMIQMSANTVISSQECKLSHGSSTMRARDIAYLVLAPSVIDPFCVLCASGYGGFSSGHVLYTLDFIGKKYWRTSFLIT
ncbi:hypothetical protein TNCV_331651 [Trichonephila clavipes]|nr:hypothetical protein TNCV_331651 [Trichonephila clavipes]